MGQTTCGHRALVPAPHPQEEAGLPPSWRVARHWVAVLYAELTIVSAFVFSMLGRHCGLVPAPPLSHIRSQIIMKHKFSYRIFVLVCPEVFVSLF